ncbi:MAG: TauD/TfdA dioxygenase family protein, partial [Gammaproteobacteria bacterium]
PFRRPGTKQGFTIAPVRQRRCFLTARNEPVKVPCWTPQPVRAYTNTQRETQSQMDVREATEVAVEPDSSTPRRLCPAAGAELRGVDVSKALGNNAFAAIRAAWLESDGVLVLRDQHLTPDEHVAFSRRFGPLFGEAEQLQDTVTPYLLPEQPAIYRVSNKVRDGKPQGRSRAGTYWHSDVSFRERPAMASLLYALELPPYGGDTLFANLYLAYEALSDAFKHKLQALCAIHDFAVRAPASYDEVEIVREDLIDGTNRAVHPLVITHPETGRKALFVNPGFTSHIQGFARDESDALLGFLYQHTIRPEFIYRHRWELNDLLIWDNRCVMHYAIADYQGIGERYLHRTTVIADRPRL